MHEGMHARKGDVRTILLTCLVSFLIGVIVSCEFAPFAWFRMNAMYGFLVSLAFSIFVAWLIGV